MIITIMMMVITSNCKQKDEKDIKFYSPKNKNKEDEKCTDESELSKLQQLYERLNSPMTRTKHMINT